MKNKCVICGSEEVCGELGFSKGFIGYDIGCICESCLEKIEDGKEFGYVDSDITTSEKFCKLPTELQLAYFRLSLKARNDIVRNPHKVLFGLNLPESALDELEKVGLVNWLDGDKFFLKLETKNWLIGG